MNRKAIVLAWACLLLVTTAACSSDGDGAKVVSTAVEVTTTVDQGTDTTAGSAELTEEQTACIQEGVAGAPALGAYTSADDLVARGTQADKEIYYTILAGCAGVAPLLDSFMTGFTSSTDLDEAGVACVRTEAGALTTEQMILLKSGDATVAAALTASITTNCVR